MLPLFFDYSGVIFPHLSPSLRRKWNSHPNLLTTYSTISAHGTPGNNAYVMPGKDGIPSGNVPNCFPVDIYSKSVVFGMSKPRVRVSPLRRAQNAGNPPEHWCQAGSFVRRKRLIVTAPPQVHYPSGGKNGTIPIVSESSRRVSKKLKKCKRRLENSKNLKRESKRG